MHRGGNTRRGRWGFGKGQGRGPARWERGVGGWRGRASLASDSTAMGGVLRDSVLTGMDPEREFAPPRSRREELSTLVERLRGLAEGRREPDERISERSDGMKQPKAQVDPDTCVGCGMCEVTCPVGAARLEEGKAVIGDGCVACGRCIDVCPVHAITIAACTDPSRPRA